MSTPSGPSNAVAAARQELVRAVQPLVPAADLHWADLRTGARHLFGPAFLWPAIVQSFATMARAAALETLRGRPDLEARLTYQRLAARSHEDLLRELGRVCRAAKFRWPDKKAGWLAFAVSRIRGLGGVEAATSVLLAQPGREGKIRFLLGFKGISAKYARNLMMDVCHPEFENAIAVDSRIQSISRQLDLAFRRYDDEEQFYLGVAEDLGLTGWELDRLLFAFRPVVISRLRLVRATRYEGT